MANFVDFSKVHIAQDAVQGIPRIRRHFQKFSELMPNPDVNGFSNDLPIIAKLVDQDLIEAEAMALKFAFSLKVKYGDNQWFGEVSTWHWCQIEAKYIEMPDCSFKIYSDGRTDQQHDGRAYFHIQASDTARIIFESAFLQFILHKDA